MNGLTVNGGDAYAHAGHGGQGVGVILSELHIVSSPFYLLQWLISSRCPGAERGALQLMIITM
jgi:hypothetical protein